MIRWTEAAEEAFAEYARAARESAAVMGADPEESVRDLRSHIEAEADRKGATVLTGSDLGAMLQAMGAPGLGKASNLRPDDVEDPNEAPSPRVPHPRPRRRRPPGYFTFFAGVLLPLVTLIVELTLGLCAEDFFDPLYTFWHILAVGLVPSANYVLWTALRRGGEDLLEREQWLRWVNGLALGIAMFYTLAFLPLMPLAPFAIPFMGLGLLPMAPALSLTAGLSLRSKLPIATRSWGPLGGALGGALAGLLLLVVGEAPSAITNVGLRMTTSTEEATRDRGWVLLRRWGSERDILRACYGFGGGPGVIPSFLTAGVEVTPAEARVIFYRVTGEGFNTRPLPRSMRGAGFFDSWDPGQGSATVGGLNADLDLVDSRLDGSLDADAAVGYLEWTWVLGNNAYFDQEARAEIALPLGAVVSRCTLWIDGEEREAAYAGTRDVREAYESIVAQRLDPLLVTHRGPNSVMVQCFPVPPGGRMQIRIGITVPLALVAPDRALLGSRG